MEGINLVCEGNRILMGSNVINSFVIIKDIEPPANQAKAKCLVDDMVSQLEDSHSTRFFKKVARLCPDNFIYRALSEVKEEAAMGKIKKSKGALFTYKIIKLAKRAGIDLSAKGGDKR